MDYEKKYKEALGWMRDLYPSLHGMVKEDAEYYFPELKESKDEKIRKEIISHLQYLAQYCRESMPNVDNWIAWLEKQGEKPQGKSALEAIKEEKVDNANKVEPKDYSSIDPHFFKTTDKVETKFKVGDFIVNDYCSGKVVKITDDAYLLDTGQDIPFSCEHNVHLWNVTKDAKEGDVLFHSDSASNGIFIFKEIIDKGFAKEVICYCDYDSEDHFCLGEHHTCCWADAKILHPATKDQRDTLMKAMADAGYTFNFEKKELKKLGQSEVTKMSDQEEIAEIPFGAKDSELQEATYFIPKGFHAEIDDDKVVIKKGEKPTTWSEEDELSCFESALFTAFSDAWQSYLLGEEVNVKRWAKEQSKELLEAAKEELKGHNSAWSEEDDDDAWLNDIISKAECNLQLNKGEIDWLKSLKDRYTWKPSSIQMECLYDAIHHYQTNGYPASKLNELYEQMSNIYKL